jgi:hypothetical protein
MRLRLLFAGVVAAATLAAPAQALAEIRAEGSLHREGEPDPLALRLNAQNTGDEPWTMVRFTGLVGHTFSQPVPSRPGECGRITTGAGPSLLCQFLTPVIPGDDVDIVFSTETLYPDGGGGHLIVQASPSDTRVFELDIGGPGVGAEQPEPPEAGRSEVVEPVSGVVRIRERGTRRFVTLRAGQTVPDRSEIDTRRGVARITVAATRDGSSTSSILVSEGRAIIDQNRAPQPLTTLKLSEPLRCPSASTATAAQRRRKKRRRLFTDTNGGRFRTRGNWAAATAGGTAWRTIDTCTATKIQVTEGTVEVRDRAARRTVDVTAPDSYTARRSRAARSSR